LAKLSGLYQVKPWAQLLADLTQQQLLHAAKLAELWQLPAAADAAAAATAEAEAAAAEAAAALLKSTADTPHI
jgi:hypothetical protein